jgi:hypothetical protein
MVIDGRDWRHTQANGTRPGVLSSGLCSVPTGDTPTQPKPS